MAVRSSCRYARGSYPCSGRCDERSMRSGTAHNLDCKFRLCYPSTATCRGTLMAQSHTLRVLASLLAWAGGGSALFAWHTLALAEPPQPSAVWTDCRAASADKAIAACAQIIGSTTETADKVADALELRGNAHFNLQKY